MITISQGSGSGGAKIARLVAMGLDLELYDDQKLQKYDFCPEPEANLN